MEYTSDQDSQEPLHNVISITIIKHDNGPGQFGFGLKLDNDNVITHIETAGSIFNHPDGYLITPGMKVLQVNDIHISHICNLVHTIHNYINTNKITLLIERIYDNSLHC